MSENFKRTNVFCSKDELENVKMLFSTPLIVVGNCFPRDPFEMIDKLSVEHGLPETDKQRGTDLKTGEFLDFME